ncbi:hypothetical protein HPB47_002742 [Ixodes persulcatus]|uniref:Uncharacterized protein n=1 Tax=Ixodes persulcatus TaxID=34615 RepID=A0AC60PLD1_IXOPE|nr:hypothetical protein HPB47_002742 [Ixodes persulcatus]
MVRNYRRRNPPYQRPPKVAHRGATGRARRPGRCLPPSVPRAWRFPRRRHGSSGPNVPQAP